MPAPIAATALTQPTQWLELQSGTIATWKVRLRNPKDPVRATLVFFEDAVFLDRVQAKFEAQS